MGNKENNGELEIGENVQRDIPGEASLPTETRPFDIYGANSSVSPSIREKKEGVNGNKGLVSMVGGLTVAIIILSIFTGFLYSEIGKLNYCINELNTSTDLRMDHIEAIKDKRGYKISELNVSISELNKPINQRTEDINQQILLQSPRPTNGVIELNKKEYNLGEWVNVIVKDDDMDMHKDRKDSIGVIVKSIRGKEHVATNLDEITESSGVFIGRFMLMNKTDEVIPGIGVIINDTITVVYYDEKNVNGMPIDVVTMAKVTGVET